MDQTQKKPNFTSFSINITKYEVNIKFKKIIIIKNVEGRRKEFIKEK